MGSLSLLRISQGRQGTVQTEDNPVRRERDSCLHAREATARRAGSLRVVALGGPYRGNSGAVALNCDHRHPRGPYSLISWTGLFPGVAFLPWPFIISHFSYSDKKKPSAS